MKRKTIEIFFKPIETGTSSQSESRANTEVINPIQVQEPEQNRATSDTVAQESRIGSLMYERDPGKRRPIEEYSQNERDAVRRFYITEGPYQPHLKEYPLAGSESHRHRFQFHWFKSFPWLEYSPHTHRAYCLPCFIFTTKPKGRCSSNTFTVKGFQTWKKVNEGKECAFLTHMGQDSNSAHNFAVRCFDNLKNNMGHIEKVMVRQNEKVVLASRLRLKVSIDSIRWLTFQACAFRGHDESPESLNQGNFLQMIKLLASYNQDVNEVVLNNAPKNAKYTSPLVQKEILHILARKVQKTIRDEIGESKFCITVDESRDESKKEQMALVLRFVDREGLIKERFLDLVHVRDTTALALKNSICAILSDNSFNVQNIRGQGYDGASNMRGEWNGLQALILRECPYAYYVHCMAHQLQLALIAASREVREVHNFFQDAIFIVNVVSVSPKRNDELIANQAAEIVRDIDLGELNTGRGANQIGSLQMSGDTRWSSHYKTICSLAKMFGATTEVLRNVTNDRSISSASRGDASGALKRLLSFDFVFIMHLMKGIMAITNVLCQALQQKSLDIINAIRLISTTKELIQDLRNNGWEPLFEKVKSFCAKHEVELPDMNRRYVDLTKSRKKYDNTTVEHHYRVDMFAVAIDQQLQELNARFSEQSTELLTLSASLDPRYDSFNISNICILAEKFYPTDFSDQEVAQLECELPHFQHDICSDPDLKSLSSLADLTFGLVKTGKASIYPMVDRIMRLVITLPVSTATTERSFSAMKLIKTGPRYRMGDGFLRDYMVVYIEKEIAAKFTSNEIVDMYDLLGSRRAKLKLIEM